MTLLLTVASTGRRSVKAGGHRVPHRVVGLPLAPGIPTSFSGPGEGNLGNYPSTDTSSQ